VKTDFFPFPAFDTIQMADYLTCGLVECGAVDLLDDGGGSFEPCPGTPIAELDAWIAGPTIDDAVAGAGRFDGKDGDLILGTETAAVTGVDAFQPEVVDVLAGVHIQTQHDDAVAGMLANDASGVVLPEELPSLFDNDGSGIADDECYGYGVGDGGEDLSAWLTELQVQRGVPADPVVDARFAEFVQQLVVKNASGAISAKDVAQQAQLVQSVVGVENLGAQVVAQLFQDGDADVVGPGNHIEDDLGCGDGDGDGDGSGGDDDLGCGDVDLGRGDDGDDGGDEDYDDDSSGDDDDGDEDYGKSDSDESGSDGSVSRDGSDSGGGETAERAMTHLVRRLMPRTKRQNMPWKHRVEKKLTKKRVPIPLICESCRDKHVRCERTRGAVRCNSCIYNLYDCYTIPVGLTKPRTSCKRCVQFKMACDRAARLKDGKEKCSRCSVSGKNPACEM